ncbi:hypothetical protein [Anaerotruncus rubiinfantis]|uniref:hypothetical protein n=1 Tax=Anaerotruncus rubiinfantis TaxID=1720200 RepID=UPI003D7934E6
MSDKKELQGILEELLFDLRADVQLPIMEAEVVIYDQNHLYFNIDKEKDRAKITCLYDDANVRNGIAYRSIAEAIAALKNILKRMEEIV